MKKIREYIKLLEEKELIVSYYNMESVMDKEVNFLSYNSKDIKKDTLFIVKGANFKKEYLDEAVKNGVFAYNSENNYDKDFPCIIVKNSTKALAVLSSLYFGYPNDKLNVIGVGGTKGKTTVTYYLKYIFDELKDNKKCAFISSIDTYDGKEEFASHITTPESYEIERHFRNAVDSNISTLVMEVSSQALKVNRVCDVHFTIGIFTNISEDHISPIEHPNFEDYYNSKLKIFDNSKVGVVNLDSDLSENTLMYAKSKCENVFTYSCINSEADFFAYDIKKEEDVIKFKVKSKDFDEEFKLTNALGAIASANYLKVDVSIIKNGLYKAKSPGRMEVYSTNDKKITVIVDYAHNKISYETLYKSVREEYPNRKIVTIFGCPGGKALNRRKDLGVVAGVNSDYVYITMEDPGSEKISDISKEIESYVKKYNDNYFVIDDRKKAIESAFELCSNLDEMSVILLLGKGREDTEKINGEYVLYPSDISITLDLIEKYN